jgi:hypothetical protein
MMPHGMQVPGHAFSHQQDPFMYSQQAHHPHQPNLPQQHGGMQQYGRLAAGGNANASNPSLALGGGGVDRLTANSLAAAAGLGNMAGATGGDRTMAAAGAADAGNAEFGGDDSRKTMEFIVQLLNPNTRETALLELSKKREAVPELALVLWHSFGEDIPWFGQQHDSTACVLTMGTGVMTSLLQEIISVYPLLSPSQLTAAASNRVCNALALLQCVASHHETRQLFLAGEFPGQALIDRNRGLISCNSSHPTLSLSLPQHHVQVSTFRVSPPHIARRHWCACQERQQRGHQLPADHRNHSTVSAYHGDWLRALQNRCHLHRTEDPA